MHPVIIVGTGGHAREVGEIVQAQHSAGQGGALYGMLTDDQSQHGTTSLGIPILGPIAWLATRLAQFSVIIAIGDNATRQRIAQQFGSELHAAKAISPHAIISPHATIGAGAMLFPNAVVGPLASIGRHSIVNVGASVSHDSTVGAYSNLNPGSRVAGNCQLGEGVALGMGANVIQGRSLGAWTVVGAGAVVIRDLPSHAKAVGVPTRLLN
ncbi:acetyltransferase [Herpetosiphon llansteffanensis]